MRLAIVSLMSGLPWGGSEALWHALADYALKQGDDVLVSVYDWGKLHEKVEGLKHKGAVIHTRRRYNPNAGFTDRIRRFVRKRQPSLDRDYRVIVNFCPDAVFISQGDSFDLAVHHRPLYHLIQKHNIPYSFICHSHVQYSLLPSKEIYPGASEIFRNAQHVYFVSNRQWKLTERRLATKISNGCFTWNPLNLSIPERPLPWPDMKIMQIAIVASLSGSKGQDTAFEALAGIKWQNRPWKLNIYGEGEGRDYLLELARFYNISDKVVFHGHKNDIRKIWKNNHALLIPSSGEGLPISLLEAMACGRLAIVTNVGGNAEVIDNGKTGFVAASPASDAFSAALENAWNEKENWKELGMAAFRKINYLLEKKPEEKIYRQLLNTKMSLKSNSK